MKLQQSSATDTPAIALSLADRQAVLLTLQHYAQAFNARNTDEIAALWPTLHKQDLTKIKDSFRDAESSHMDLKCSGPPQIDGDHATVTCLRSIAYTFKGGIQKSGESSVNIQLIKESGSWVIQSVQ
jgi:hypothetical protein